MTIRPLVTGPDTPILRTVCQEVTVFDDDLRSLIQDLTDTMLAPQEDGVTGIGIAAPQIGVDARVMLVTLGVHARKGRRVLTLVNPRITWSSSHQTVMEEGCLSLPNVFGKVRRPSKIQVEWQNAQGELCQRKFDGWDARILQHELDHLNGVLFIDSLEKA